MPLFLGIDVVRTVIIMLPCNTLFVHSDIHSVDDEVIQCPVRSHSGIHSDHHEVIQYPVRARSTPWALHEIMENLVGAQGNAQWT